MLCLSRCSVAIIATRRSSSHALFSSRFLSLLPVRHCSLVVGALGFFNLGRMGRARGRRVICSDSNAGSDPFTPTVQAAAKIKSLGPKMSFCPSCGGPIEQQIPEGEHELRAVCTLCHRIHYQNPKMVGFDAFPHELATTQFSALKCIVKDQLLLKSRRISGVSVS